MFHILETAGNATQIRYRLSTGDR